MRRATCLLAGLLLFACAEENTDAARPTEEATTPPPEEPEPEVASGPVGTAITAHCGRMDPVITIGQSEEVELVIRERNVRSTSTLTMETGAVGWLCLFDRFGPGEERVPRGAEHVGGVRLLWADPQTRELGDQPGPEAHAHFAIAEEAIPPIQELARSTHRSEPDRELCERALATPLPADDVARDEAVAIRFGGGPRISRNRPARMARAIVEVLEDCGERAMEPTP